MEWVSNGNVEKWKAGLDDAGVGPSDGGGGAAAAGSSPASDGSGGDALSAFLAKHNFASLSEPLRKLGAEVPADLLELEEDDVASLELKKLQLKKWDRAIASLKSTATASARARTEL